MTLELEPFSRTHGDSNSSLPDAERQLIVLRLATVFPGLASDNTLLTRLAHVISYDEVGCTLARCPLSRFTQSLRCVYVWMRSSQLSFGDQPPVAPYAVIFQTECEGAFRPIALAKTVVDFMGRFGQAGTAGDGKGFTLDFVDLCYQPTAKGVSGVMFYGPRFGRAYLHALESERERLPGYTVHSPDLLNFNPVSFLPKQPRLAYTWWMYEAMLDSTRSLYFQRFSNKVPFGGFAVTVDDNDLGSSS